MPSDCCFNDQGCLSEARSEVVKLKVSADPFELSSESSGPRNFFSDYHYRSNGDRRPHDRPAGSHPDFRCISNVNIMILGKAILDLRFSKNLAKPPNTARDGIPLCSFMDEVIHSGRHHASQWVFLAKMWWVENTCAVSRQEQLLMQDLLGSFCPFDMVANKPQDSGCSLDRIPLLDHNEQSTMSTYDEPTASKGGKKKKTLHS